MDKTVLLLIRHGETIANRENIFRGRMDFPLNDNGIIQAKNLAEELSSFSINAIYSSPLLRALDTAKVIAQTTKNKIEISTALINISLGNWEGVPHTEIIRKYPEQYNLWRTEPEKLKIPGAETLSDVQKRSVDEVNRIVRIHTNSTIAITSHRAVLKPLIAGLIGIAEPYFWKIHIDNAAYCVVHHTQLRGYTLYQLNHNEHLTDFVEEDLG